MSGRRWSSEAQVLLEMERLADMSDDTVATYKAQAVEAAEAEALHKSLRARRILRAQAQQSGRTSIAAAEVVAEADDDVADAYQDRLVKAALSDATREQLRTIRTNQDALRTAAASHRTSPI